MSIRVHVSHPQGAVSPVNAGKWHISLFSGMDHADVRDLPPLPEIAAVGWLAARPSPFQTSVRVGLDEAWLEMLDRVRRRCGGAWAPTTAGGEQFHVGV